MIEFRIAAGVLLVVLLGALMWALSHWRKIRRRMIEDDAMPKSAPGTNLMVLICAVLVVFICLFAYLMLHS